MTSAAVVVPVKAFTAAKLRLAGVLEPAERAIVAHADLPLATRLDWVAVFPGVTLVPDRRRDGTNVAAVPTGAGFAFHYGGGSFAAQRAEAAPPRVPGPPGFDPL